MATQSRHEPHELEKGGKADEAEIPQYRAHTREYTYRGNASENIPRSVRYLSRLLIEEPSMPLSKLTSPISPKDTAPSSPDDYTWEPTPPASQTCELTLPDRTRKETYITEPSFPLGTGHLSTSKSPSNMPINSETHTQFRITCLVPGCTVSLKKRDLLRHNEREHGATQFCTHPDCDYPGTRRTSILRAHIASNHPEIFVSLDVPTESGPDCQPAAHPKDAKPDQAEDDFLEAHAEASHDVTTASQRLEEPFELGCPLSHDVSSSSQQDNEFQTRGLIKAEEPLKFSPHEDDKAQPASLGENTHLECGTIPGLDSSGIPSDVSDRPVADILRVSSCSHGDYFGIGFWAIQVLESLGASSFIDFTTADLYAAFDGECESSTSQRGEGSRTSNSTQKTVQDPQNGAVVRRTERKYSQKRPCRDQRDEDDDGDPDKSKKPRIKGGPGSDLNRKLACPFNKNLRTYAQHPGCARKGFPDIARLKEHLYRSHCHPLCARCGLTFKTPDLLDAHLRTDDCEVGPREPYDSITPGVQNELRSRKKYGKNVKELWFNIYYLIFPGDGPPTDPYQDLSVLDDLSTLSGNESLHQFEQRLYSIIRDYVPAVDAAEALKSRILSHFSAARHQRSTTQQDYQGPGASASQENDADIGAPVSDPSESHYSTSQANSPAKIKVAPIAVPSRVPLSRGSFHQSDVQVISKTPIPPTPQLIHTQTPLSDGMSIRRTTSGESWAESGYGSVTCSNPDCVPKAGCVQCVDLSIIWDSNTAGMNIDWNETFDSSAPALPAKSLAGEDDNSLLPVIPTADLIHFFDDQFAEFGAESSYAADGNPGER